MEIAEDIRRRVRDGQLDEDGRVGTFGSLEEDYGAAKGTIESALRILRMEGTVMTIAGKGIFAATSHPLEEENLSLQKRVTELEEQVAELRKNHASLQATVVKLFHFMGKQPPNEGDPPQRQQEVG
jgi:DNA-binding GntR family transcriptional regulator